MAIRTTDTPNGFTPISRNGGPYTGQVNRYLTTGTAVFVGDPVKLQGTAGAAGLKVNGQDAQGIPYVVPDVAVNGSGYPVGIVVGFEPAPDQLGQNYADATNRRIALVADDPDLEFVGQEDGAGDYLIVTDVGAHITWVTTTGSTVTGRSAYELDSDSTTVTTTAAPLKLRRLYNTPNNDLPTASNNHTLWVCSFVNHAYRTGPTGV